jgi:hypothetical protein
MLLALGLAGCPSRSEWTAARRHDTAGRDVIRDGGGGDEIFCIHGDDDLLDLPAPPPPPPVAVGVDVIYGGKAEEPLLGEVRDRLDGSGPRCDAWPCTDTDP